MQDIARYYPIVTAIFSFIIVREMFVDYREHKLNYLLCWTLGVCSFGLAALAASINVLFGWSLANLKFWYIIGALVGGFPLAQGTLYLLASRKVANCLTVFFLLVIAVASVAVALTPVSIPPGFDHELTGKVFTWKWVRSFSPIVNSYSFLVVLGGGIYSIYRYYSSLDRDETYLANANIALGGILPGFGGILMRMGYTNALFVTDFLALALIYSGYRIFKSSLEL
jgi:hypothetical protein